MQTEEIRSRLLHLEEAIQRIHDILVVLMQNDQIILELLNRKN